MTDGRLSIESPEASDHEAFTDADAPVARLIELYRGSTSFLCDRFAQVMVEGRPNKKFRAF